MKNYKYLVPIVLVALYVVAIYSYVTEKESIINEYESHLELARDYRVKGIEIDAEKSYMAGYEVIASPELGKEIGEFYMEAELNVKTEQWGNLLIEEYPKEPEGYEILLEEYAREANYSKLFKALELANGRQVESERIEELKPQFMYEYYLSGKYDDVGIFDGIAGTIMDGELWGYITLQGKNGIGIRYKKAGYYTDGLAPVIDGENQAYFIDEYGNKKKILEIKETVEELGLITGQVFAAKINSEWSFYNMNSELVFGPYDEVTALGNGIGGVKEGDYWTVVDVDGDALNKEKYDNVIVDEKGVMYRNERMFVEKDHYIQMLDVEGKIVNEEAYTDADVFRDSTLAAVKKELLWGFIDKDAEQIIDFTYEGARSFSNGLAAVKVDGKWGYIDMEGTIVIDCVFEDAKDFNSSGCAFVKMDGMWSLLRLYSNNY